MSEHTYWIEGMTCHSCEITVERCWQKLPGVRKVHVNAATGEANVKAEGDQPTMADLRQALRETDYIVHENPVAKNNAKKSSLGELIGLFALVFLIGYILSRFGLFKINITLNSSLSFGAVFVIGLVAASSSCIAVVGGLLLSSAAKFNERHVSSRPLSRMRPVVLFVLGRITGYTVLGGLLGVIGNILSPSPTVTAIITILAALYMIVMGLEMLHISPTWLKRLLPRMPKKLSHRIMDAGGHEHPVMPFILGAGTFFLPCGFTQALQLYALTTGSFLTSAGIMLAFALGTAPALLALGYASSSLKGKFGTWFFKFSGALVIVLGLWNVQNGLAIAGYPLSWSPFRASETANASSAVTMENGEQVVRMKVGYSGYSPNHFTLRANVPVRWVIDGTNAGGCATSLISRQLGIQKFLQTGDNIINFTPLYPGEIAFSCSMGMYRGSFTVIN